MNFYDYWTPDEAGIDNPSIEAANFWTGLGYKVLACENKEPIKKCRPSNKFRTKPIHALNSAFYFDGNPDIAVFTGEGLEVVDIDCKYDTSGQLYPALMRAIRYALPDLYDTIVVQASVNGGYHIFYKCSQIGSSHDLATRPANPSELKAGDRHFTLIETRGEGGYIMVSPTPGYTFIKGNPADIPTITPEDRITLLAVCRSFDKMPPVPLERMSKTEVDRPDAPWNVFNARNGAEWTKNTLQARGWEILDYKEDRDKFFILRPGAMSKTSGVIWKESGILYLFTHNTEFQADKGYTPFGVLCQLSYDGDFKACAKDQADQGIGSFSFEDGEFHFTTKEGSIRPKMRAIIEWMTDIGIRRYYLNSKDFEIVHIVDKTVKMVDSSYVKNIFCSYVHRTSSAKVDEYFLTKFVSIFSREGIINLVEVLTDEAFIKPSATSAYLLFKNTTLHVSGDDTKYLTYEELPGYVWYDNIIQRDLTPAPAICEMGTFISNISNSASNRISMFRTAIGYLLHPFKDPSNPRVIVLMDEFFEEGEVDEPEGGTGKGMFIRALSYFKKTVSIDGKAFRFDKSFAFQRVHADTQIVAFEDVVKGFDFEKLFSVITEGWVVEKKGKDEFFIPFERSPKILFTSNYALKGSSKSHERRRYEIEVSDHYSHSHTIKQEFGHLFFIDWSAQEWNAFDNYMIESLQLYLQFGLSDAVHFNLQRRRLFEEVGKDFIEWIEARVAAKNEQEKGNETWHWREEKTGMLLSFTDKYPNYRNKLTVTRFTKWLSKWCEFHLFGLDGRNLYNGVMCYSIKISRATVLSWSGESIEDDKLPF